jgi:hypothetical protein
VRTASRAALISKKYLGDDGGYIIFVAQCGGICERFANPLGVEQLPAAFLEESFLNLLT